MTRTLGWRSITLLTALMIGLLIGFSIWGRQLQQLAPVIALDSWAAAMCETWRRPYWDVSLHGLTMLGAGIVVTIFTAIGSGIAILNGRAITALQIVLASGGAGLMSRLLKIAVERERPALLPALTDFNGFSFPSGHALLASALYLTLAFIAQRTLRYRVGNFALATAILVIVVIAFSRVYLRVHFASDVVAGLALGICWALLVDRALRPFVLREP